MHTLARFALGGGGGGGGGGGQTTTTNDELLAKDVRENARRYILGERGKPPTDIEQRWKGWLRAHNCDLAGVLLRNGLADPSGRWLSWLRPELASSASWKDKREGVGEGVCSGVYSVDDWFVGA